MMLSVLVGTAVGIAFADETTMSVDPNSTMVIDDFVYDPENPNSGINERKHIGR